MKVMLCSPAAREGISGGTLLAAAAAAATAPSQKQFCTADMFILFVNVVADLHPASLPVVWLLAPSGCTSTPPSRAGQCFPSMVTRRLGCWKQQQLLKMGEQLSHVSHSINTTSPCLYKAGILLPSRASVLHVKGSSAGGWYQGGL